MRNHGVPNFPDPGSGGVVALGQAPTINKDSPAFIAARQECASLTPIGKAGRSQTVTPTQIAAALRWADCLRSHGVSRFPDPNSQGVIVNPPSLTSPAFERASKACGFGNVPVAVEETGGAGAPGVPTGTGKGG
jgi:hypothetical protein